METAGHIYFISDGAAIKIGYSVNVEERRSNLQSAHSTELKILASFKGSHSDEQHVHYHFRHLRGLGEWFRPEPDLTEFVADVARYGSWIPHRVTLRDALTEGLRPYRRSDQRRALIVGAHSEINARLDRWRRDGFPNPEVEKAAVYISLDLAVLVGSKHPHKIFIRGLADGLAALERALPEKQRFA